MKSVILINNKYHGFNEEKLEFKVGQLGWYLNRKKKDVHKVIIVNNDDELDLAKEYLLNTDELEKGDGVITLEISDLSKDDNEAKRVILALCDKGVTFRAFHEFFNTENEKEKELLLKLLEWLCAVKTTYEDIPF